MKEVFGISLSYLLLAALVVLFIVGSIGFAVWYNYHLAVPLANSERYVQTCNIQYLTTQKAKIEDNLNAIANNEAEISNTSDIHVATALKAQEQQNARNIYNALDASQCSRAQIIQDMPELQKFFSDFPAR